MLIATNKIVCNKTSYYYNIVPLFVDALPFPDRANNYLLIHVVVIANERKALRKTSQERGTDPRQFYSG